MKRYPNLYYIPTQTIKAILDDPYTRGVDGSDYGPVKDVLEVILWERSEKELEKFMADYNRAEKQRLMEQRTGRHARKSPKQSATTRTKG